MNYLTAGQRAIGLFSPANNALTSPSNLIFVWNNVPGVGVYDLQMAADTAFTQLVLNKRVNDNSYVFQSSDLVGRSTLESATYYWRVKVPAVSNNLQSVTWALHSFSANANGGVDLYVNCNSTVSVQVGTKANPYKTIAPAIRAADNFRAGNPDVPMRLLVAKGTYTEFLTLYAGISLLGGYDPADWSRNISANVTTVIPVAETALSIGADVTTVYQATTVVEGFTFLSGSSANAVGTNAQVVLNSASPILHSNIFSKSSTATYVGMQFSGGSPVISSNSFTMNTNNLDYAVFNGTACGSVTITQNTFTGMASEVIVLNQCGGNVSGNTINVSSVPNAGVRIVGTSTQPLFFQGNTLTLTNATASARGIYIDAGASPVITNNIVTIACAGSCTVNPSITAIGVFSGSPTITNNVLVSGATGASTTVLNNQNSATAIATNNVLISTGGTTQTCHNMPSNVMNNYYIACTGAAGSNTSMTFATANFAGGVTYSVGFDFHLTASSLAGLQTGGLNAATSVCGTAANLSCGNVTTDKDGVARTVPYSIGPFEY